MPCHKNVNLTFYLFVITSSAPFWLDRDLHSCRRGDGGGQCESQTDSESQRAWKRLCKQGKKHFSKFMPKFMFLESDNFESFNLRIQKSDDFVPTILWKLIFRNAYHCLDSAKSLFLQPDCLRVVKNAVEIFLYFMY